MPRDTFPGVLLCAIVLTACTASWADQGSGRKRAFTLVADHRPMASVVIGEDAGRVEQTAVNKLLAGVQRDGGVTLPIAHAPNSASAGLVVMGTVKSNPALARLADAHQLPLQELGQEEFLLRTLVANGQPCLVLAGGDPRGVLYGAQEAVSQVLTCTPAGEVIVTQCDIRRRPVLAERGTYTLTCWGGCPRYPRSAWEDAIDSMCDAGMNRIMFWMDGLFRSRRFPGAFLNKPKQHYHGTTITDEDIRKLIAYAHDRGMAFYFGSGVFGWFTAGAFFAKEFPEAAAKEVGGLCPSSLVAQRATVEYLSEMIEVFPEADGYMLEIRDELGECACSTCQKKLDESNSKQFGQSELDFLEKLTAVVWEKHSKAKFCWLIGYDPHKDDPMYYERIRGIGRDPRMEWLNVRNQWEYPTSDGTRKPLREFSERIYHWDQYYRFDWKTIQSVVRRTANEGLNGFLPAYEPGFRSYSVYPTGSPTPFPVRLIPFCLTQFAYRTFTWEPNLSRQEYHERLWRAHFSEEIPRQMASELVFLKGFMKGNYTVLTHAIGAGLGPDGSGLLDTVEDIWKVERTGGDERKKRLFEGVGADIRRVKHMADGTREMGRLNRIEQRIADLRPKASRRSLASLEMMQQAIDDIKAKVAECGDYAAEADEALQRITRYLERIEARNTDSPDSGPTTP